MVIFDIGCRNVQHNAVKSAATDDFEDSDTAVFFWIETLSYPKSKMYGRKSGRTMENLILGSVIKIFAKRCMENYVWR